MDTTQTQTITQQSKTTESQGSDSLLFLLTDSERAQFLTSLERSKQTTQYDAKKDLYYFCEKLTENLKLNT